MVHLPAPPPHISDEIISHWNWTNHKSDPGGPKKTKEFAGMTQTYNSAYSISLKLIPVLMGEFLGQIQELYIWAYRKEI